jgi:hypothetical protein
MWTGTGAREKRVRVKFSAPYKAAPAVHVSLSMLDIERRHNQRMDLGPDAVTETGFQIVFRTWDDTKIARARATWMAVGELADEDDWSLY